VQPVTIALTSDRHCAARAAALWSRCACPSQVFSSQLVLSHTATACLLRTHLLTTASVQPSAGRFRQVCTLHSCHVNACCARRFPCTACTRLEWTVCCSSVQQASSSSRILCLLQGACFGHISGPTRFRQSLQLHLTRIVVRLRSVNACRLKRSRRLERILAGACPLLLNTQLFGTAVYTGQAAVAPSFYRSVDNLSPCLRWRACHARHTHFRLLVHSCAAHLTRPTIRRCIQAHPRAAR
jgi:hypothetical protein